MKQPTWQDWIKGIAAIHQDKPVISEHETLIRYYYNLDLEKREMKGVEISSQSHSNIIASASWWHYKLHRDKQYSLVCSDLDWTLIKPKSGNKFPVDGEDWVLIESNVNKILSYYQKAAIDRFVIFTNQGGIQAGHIMAEDFERKMVAVRNALYDFKTANHIRFEEIGFYYAPNYNKDRKPYTGMFEKARRDCSLIIPEKSVYFGDMDSDREFAANCGMEYVDVS